jgi:hypothetical protein
MSGFLTACDDDDVNIYTDPIITEVVTGDATTTALTATINGRASDLSAMNVDSYTVGTVYSTSENPTAGGTFIAGTMGENGDFVTNITGLQEGVTYYYASCVTLQKMQSYYGEIKSFVTTSGEVAAAEPASLTATAVNLGGTVNGVSDLIEAETLDYGIILGTDAASLAATGKRIHPAGKTNSFSIPVENLVPNTTYSYAVYMIPGGKEIVSPAKTFTTPKLCDASVESPDDYVDMGTSVEWCRYNVGASAEKANGALIGYGDVTGLKRSENTADYATGNIAQSDKDVAVASAMGYLPTKADFEALMAACDITKEDDCYKFTSKKTGNVIYFPVDGIREGETLTEGIGVYATGQSYSNEPDYTDVLMLNGTEAKMAIAKRSTGVSVRPVRKPFAKVITPDSSKLNIGDLEGNGRIRIEIYNEFGQTKDNPGVDISQINFSESMAVTFTVKGINDNLKEGAATSFKAGLEFGDASWDPSYWSNFSNQKYDAVVTGDGTYTVWMETASDVEGAVVFCIDIDGLGTALTDASKIQATVDRIALDPKKPIVQTIAVDNTKVLFNNKDGNGVDGRIEIFNEYGDTKGLGADFSGMKFPAGTMTITFKIEGIDGNLKADATKNYKADISYADASWDPSYWSGQCATADVTADGTYTVQCALGGECEGAVVWCVEVYGLWQDLVDTSKVKATIESVTVPNYAE